MLKNYLKVLNLEKNSLLLDYLKIRNLSYLEDYFKYLLIIESSNPRKSLDFGGGNGHVSYLLMHGLNLDVDTYLVNPDIATVDFLNKLDLNIIISSNSFELPFSSESYDLVISSEVIEHINEFGGDLNYSLNEIIRILKVGGNIFIWRLPFAFSIWEYFRYIFRGWYHPERYTPLQITQIAKKYNLELVKL